MVVGKSELAPSFLICYASQKGTAQSIAEEISEQSALHNLKSNCHLSCISEIKNVKKLIYFSCVVFVGSTTGEGDPPDTAQQFMRELQRVEREATSLSWLHYTVLGLGDTNYTNFCNFGKTLDNHLQKIKAQRFYACGWADDGVGLEIVVEPWLEGLFPAIRTTLKLADSEVSDHDEKDYVSSESFASNLKEMKGESQSYPPSRKSNPDLEREIMPHPRPNLSTIFPLLDLPSEDEILNNPLRKCVFDAKEDLALPAQPSSFLKVGFRETRFERSRWGGVNFQGAAPYPLARSEVIPCRVSGCRRLTKEDTVKKSLEITLEPLSGNGFEYEPGDSFGVVVENREVEVNLLLRLLQVDDKADFELNMFVDPLTQKRGAQIPKFLPSGCSLRYAFTRCLDIRAIPKKLLVRALIEFTQAEDERRRMEEWVSREGAAEYARVFRTEGLTLLDLLLLFPSCVPPPPLLLEHLPRLLPRPYSATSSPLISPHLLSFVFNVVNVPKGPGAVFKRKGLCTGWLDQMTNEIYPIQKASEEDPLSPGMERLWLYCGTEELLNEVLIYFRSNQMFHLPKSIETPVIMIGPGTGVAPFLGFLKHRKAQMKLTEAQWDTRDPQMKSAQELKDAPEAQTSTSEASIKPPFSWLFFGCHNRSKDFLYREELEAMVRSKVLTQLSPSFSRDENEDRNLPRYVQDSLLLRGEEVVEWVHAKVASVYVCGDARNMARNVQDTFILLFQNHLKMSEHEAKKYLAKMQMTQRYLQDVWT